MQTTPTARPEIAERRPLKEFAERAYLEYAMYVILDRALPHVGDGLKPVQRRIVYAMDELRLNAGAKYKKSARTVGDVLGKFHPHGDSACYEAMVLMAQPFSFRYPLIDGQGNWGAPDDPKSFAAMRYTEARLSRYTDVLLEEIGQGTVDWVPNFDGTLQEPAVLPARLPNVLLNGGTGIAVGMATDIPPHNLREVVAACIHLLDHPDADEAALFTRLPGPDFPTEAEIVTPAEDLLQIYRTGGGMIRMRAVFEEENGDIVITALPHQVSGARVMEQIAAQMQAKKLPMVVDLRDESDHEDPIRLVIVPRSNRVDKQVLMDHLFATTDLERSYRVNFNLIGLDGRPRVMGLKTLLSEWLTFRRQTVRRRLVHRLAQVRERLHLLEGLLIAYLNIDEVIAIIRTEENPSAALVARFGISEAQAEAILSMRLRHLARLEEIKIRAEADTLGEERERLEKILASEVRLKAVIRRELKSDAASYGDPRRSPIVERREAQALTETDLLPTEPVTVVLSVNGWVRAAKGHDIDPTRLSYKAGDGFLAEAHGRSHQPAVFLDTTGRCYTLPAHSLPSARGQGEPLSGRLNLPPQAGLITVLMGDPEQRLLLASDAGYGFVAVLEDLLSKNRGGKAVLSVPAGARPLAPLELGKSGSDRLAVITNQGRLLIFPLSDLPRLSRGKGNQMIGIPPAMRKKREEYVSCLAVLPKGANLVVQAGKRQLTLKPGNLSDYEGERGRRGRKLPRGFRKVDGVEVIEGSQMQLL